MTTEQELFEALRKASAAADKGDPKAAKAAKRFRQMIQEYHAAVSGSDDLPPAESYWDYFKYRAKKGLVEGAGNTALLGSMITGGASTDKADILDRMANMRESLDVNPLAAPSPFAKWIGGGIEAVEDPTNILFNRGGLVTRAASSFFPGVGAEFGMDVAKQADLGGVSELAAGVIGGVAGGSLNAGLDRSVRLLSSALKFGGKGGLKETAGRHAFSTAEQHVKNTIKAAIARQPDLAERLNEALILAQKNDMGELPISALINNKTIQDSLESLAAKDPAFAAIYSREMTRAKNAIDSAQVKLFGDPLKAQEELSKNLGEARAVKGARINQQIDERIRKEGEPFGPYYQGRGMAEQTSNILDGREPEWRIESGKFYSKADKIAREADVMLPEEGTMNIYNFVGAEQRKDIYSRFPTIFGLIRDRARPATDGTVRQWDPMPYEDVRSLQKELNKELRALKPEQRQERAALQELKNVVDSTISAAGWPTEVLDNIKKGDSRLAYEYTLRDIGREVFDESGLWNPRKFFEWAKDERNTNKLFNIVDPLTGRTIGETLGDSPNKIARLAQRKDLVKQIQVAATQAHILDQANMTPTQFVNNLYEDPNFLSKTLLKYSKNPNVMQAIRAWALDSVLESREPSKLLSRDKNKAPALDRIFGPEYTQKVADLASIAESIKIDPTELHFNVQSGITKDFLEEKINVPAAMVFSKLRNPIISKWQALIELSSKGLTKAADNAYEQKMRQILLDPKELAKVIDIVKEGAKTGKPPSNFADFLKNTMVGEALSTYMYVRSGAAVGARSWGDSVMDDGEYSFGMTNGNPRWSFKENAQ